MFRSSSSADRFSHENPLFQIKQDDKLFTKLVSKETSIANPSFRSGVSVAVPFLWETQPGTPKHKLFPDHHSHSYPPTLTPPPSYYFTTPNPNKKHHSKSKLLNILLLRLVHFKKGNQINMAPSSPSSSLSSSSSYSSSVNSNSSKGGGRGRRRLLSMGSILFDDHEFQVSVPRSFSKSSMLCFRS